MILISAERWGRELRCFFVAGDDSCDGATLSFRFDLL